MGFGKLFGKDSDKQSHEYSSGEAQSVDCPHVAMTPRWDSVEDMGKADRATYVCDSCHQSLSSSDAERSVQGAAERMRREVA